MQAPKEQELYSITDRTFELSLDDDDDVDDVADDSNTAVDSKATGLGSILDEGLGSNSDHPKDDMPLEHELITSSLDILMRMSGNSMPLNSVTSHSDLYSSLKMVHKLCESNECKLKFLSKNYSFLEGLYDSSRKELEWMKLQLRRSETHVTRLEQELETALNDVDKHAIAKHLPKGIAESPSEAGCDNPQSTQFKLATALQTIERQNAELRSYKRFIKDMMDTS